MSRAAIFGGTFDPPHLGHAAIARSLSEQEDIDRVLVLPTWKSPMKTLPKANIHHRLAMTSLAVGSIPKVTVHDHEAFPYMDTTGFSVYTADTLRFFSSQYRELVLVLGSDNLCRFKGWKDSQEILGLARLLIVRRPGDVSVPDQYRSLVLNMESPQISSTEIRQSSWHSGGASTGLPSGISGRVGHYIRQNGLYLAEDHDSLRLLRACESRAAAELSGKRLNHSLAVSIEAERLAIIYGLNSQRARIAGLLHDLAREKSSGELQELFQKPPSGLDFSSFSGKVQAVLHGPCGAGLAKQELGIDQKDVLEAIAFHATGLPGMGPLAAAVYIADLAEPTRVFSQARGLLEKIRGMDLSLGRLLLTAARIKMSYLEKGAGEFEGLGALFLEHLERGGWREYDIMPSCGWRI